MPETPIVADEDARKFAFTVGKAVQNFGTIEYLVNELIAKLVDDPLTTSALVQLGVSRRLDLLASLVARHESTLKSQGWEAGSLFTDAKAVFRERNKIAHNPYVIRQSVVDGKPSVTFGIHVVRYHDEGTAEQWIGLAELESVTTTARDVFLQFNELQGRCNHLAGRRPNAAA